MGKYFGTDGVRGVAGADLTCETGHEDRPRRGSGADRTAPATAPAS